LERDPDLEADAVRAPEQLDNQHNFPNQRQAGAGGGGEIRRELRQYNMAQPRPCPHAKYLRHVVESVVERTRALAYGHGRDRKLVQRHCRDRRGFREPGPDIGEHDNY
jgi:hypothetical protein